MDISVTPAPAILHFEELSSTNSYVKERAGELSPYTVVTAGFQTAGRGQRGNSWESEQGKNLLMSLLFVPQGKIEAAGQFVISKAVSVGMVEALYTLLGGAEHPPVAVKWPNDIYIGDCKAAGILIENSISAGGCISHSVIGIGLNVNQKQFLSQAPNPVSLIKFAGDEFDLEHVTAVVAEKIIARLTDLDNNGSQQIFLGNLSRIYLSLLWRAHGFHRYALLEASSAPAPTALHLDSPASSPISDPQSSASTSTVKPAASTFTPTIQPASSTSTFTVQPIASTFCKESPESSRQSHIHSDYPLIFEAEIADVAPDGPIIMRLRDGTLHTFNFKEITPVLAKFDAKISR